METGTGEDGVSKGCSHISVRQRLPSMSIQQRLDLDGTSCVKNIPSVRQGLS